nr:unnamed protein product [Callosobruchus analis]
MCRVCNKEIAGGITHIKGHSTTKLHIKNKAANFGPSVSKLVSSVCPDSEIGKQLACGRTKGANICLKSNVPYSFEEVVNETTDITSSKCLAVVARYFCKYNINDNFIGLIEVSTSQHITGQRKNLVGSAADNCAVLIGDKTGVKARLREKNSNMFVLGCSCHSFHLAASAACCKLPQWVENFARDIYTYFAHSSKKLGELKVCQVFADTEPHTTLKLSQTRWLSLQAVDSRLVEQWPALILHFTAAAMEKDSAYDTNAILNALNNKCFKLYFYFLTYILKIVNILNLEFQRETPKLYLLQDRLTTYKTIMSNFIKIDLIDKFKDNLHLANSEFLIKKSNLNDSELKPIRINCLNFYIELCFQIRNRFDFNDPIFKMLEMLNPNNVPIGSIESIAECKIHFPNLVSDVEQLNDEWRFLNKCGEIHKFKDLPLGEFWWRSWS